MTQYKYIIIGAGMTGDAAVKGIRNIDKNGSIALIGSDKEKPYDRPPLSKKLWTGMEFEKIWRNTPEENLTFFLGRTAEKLDATLKK